MAFHLLHIDLNPKMLQPFQAGQFHVVDVSVPAQPRPNTVDGSVVARRLQGSWGREGTRWGRR